MRNKKCDVIVLQLNVILYLVLCVGWGFDRCLDCLATEPDTCLSMELDRMTADWESQVAEVERLESDLTDTGDQVKG